MIYFIFLRGKERGEEVEKRKKKMKQKVSDLIRCGSSFVASGALSGLLSFSGRKSNKSLAFRRRADNDSVKLDHYKRAVGVWTIYLAKASDDHLIYLFIF